MARELRELSDRRPGLAPPKFSLLTLLLLIAGFAVLLVIGKYSGAIAAFVAIITGLSIFAHMASTSIGGRLTDNGQQPIEFEGEEADVEQSASRMVQPVAAQASDFAPTTQLSRQEPLNRKPIIASISIGAFSFAVLGATILTIVMWDDLSIMNIMFGAFSSAVLGGIFGYIVSCFYQVVRDALSEAQKDA